MFEDVNPNEYTVLSWLPRDNDVRYVVEVIYMSISPWTINNHNEAATYPNLATKQPELDFELKRKLILFSLHRWTLALFQSHKKS